MTGYGYRKVYDILHAFRDTHLYHVQNDLLDRMKEAFKADGSQKTQGR